MATLTSLQWDGAPMASRTTAVSGAAVALSARKIKDKGRELAAHLLEASADDIEYSDGRFFVRGSPNRAQTIQDIALMANVAWNMPQGMEPGLEATTFYDPPNFTYPFGAHVALVEVDVNRGTVELKRYIAVDDCGLQINPMIVEGQVHGGVVQGVGQALWEGAVYDENGQLLTGSMLDYALPRADVLPDLEVFSTSTPSPHHPLGGQGRRRNGGHCIHRDRLQRSDRRPEASGRAEHRDAPHPGAGVARHSPTRLKGKATCMQPISTTMSPIRLPKRCSCWSDIRGHHCWPVATASFLC